MLTTAIRGALGIKTVHGPADDFWYRPISTPTAAGVTVGDTEALAASTFWACVRVLSDTVGAMPWHLYRREGEGDEQEDIKAKSDPWYHVLHDAPNVYQEPITFKAMGVMHLSLRGNFVCRIDQPTYGWEWPQLVPLNPDRIKIERGNNGTLNYQHTHQDGQTRDYSQDQIFHVKLMSGDGVWGYSPLTYAKATLGLGIAQERHASSIYGGGGFFKYFLKTTKKLGPEGRKNFRESWRDLHGDPGNFSPPILEDDMDIKTLGMSLEDSQLLESRKFGSYEVCQFLGVPPHLVFLLDRATFSNIEHQSIEFSTIHLNPWLVRFEQAIQPQLAADHFSQFARDSIVRGDIGARYDAYSKALQGRPFMVPNDVRRLENLPPVEGWDEPADPLNMAAVGPVGQQQAAVATVEDDDEPQAVANNIRPLIAAAAERIVSREVKSLRARAAKAEDNRQLYNAWAGEWFAKHVEFCKSIMQPIAEAAGREVADIGLNGFCELYLGELQAADNVAAKLDEWEQTKAEDITSHIEVILCTSK